jgi:histidyl-tRNA synthetase
MERMILAMPKENSLLEIVQQVPQIFLIALDEKACHKAYEILNQLRNSGISSDMSFKMSSMKSQMRLADKLQARFVMILGEDELKKESAALKNMQTGDQKEVAFKDIQGISRLLN